MGAGAAEEAVGATNAEEDPDRRREISTTGVRETVGEEWQRAGAGEVVVEARAAEEEVVVEGLSGVKGAGGRLVRLRSAR